MCDPRLNRLVSLLFTVSPMPYPGNILGVFGHLAFLASVMDCNDVCRSLKNVVSLQLASFVVFKWSPYVGPTDRSRFCTSYMHD